MKSFEKNMLAEMLDYQHGAVVSRALIKKQSGSVTLFAFDNNEGLSEHTAPYDAMVVVLDGEAEVIISGISSRLTSGETITMPANEPHAVKALSRFKMLLIMIRA